MFDDLWWTSQNVLSSWWFCCHESIEWKNNMLKWKWKDKNSTPIWLRPFARLISYGKKNGHPNRLHLHAHHDTHGNIQWYIVIFLSPNTFGILINFQGCRFGPQSSRQTLDSPIFRSSLVPSVADCFRKMYDKSATLILSHRHAATTPNQISNSHGSSTMFRGVGSPHGLYPRPSIFGLTKAFWHVK